MGRAWKALGAQFLEGVLLTALCCATSLAWAGLPETPRPRQFTVADGLPSNRINGITEDQQGYLWIATSDGLVRYDGVDFRTWRVEQGLGDNFVWAVHVDARNRVWVATQQAGLAVLDPQRRSFRHYNRRNTPALKSNEVWSIASTPDGGLWVGTSDSGLYRLAPDGRIARFTPRAGDPRSLPNVSVGQLATAPDGTLWIGTKGGVARWTGRAFERVPADALNSPDVNGLYIESDGTVWIGTTGGVSVRRPNGSYTRAPWAEQGIAEKVLHVLQRDREGQYWFDVDAGLGRDGAGQVVPVPLYSSVANGLIRPSWVGAYEDREGGLWFASYNSGLWHLAANWRRFGVLSRQIDDTDSIANAHVRGIAPAANGDMWLVGTGGTLDRIDVDTGRVVHVASNVGDGLVLMSVFEDRSGAVWASFSDGVARIDPASGESVRWRRGDESDAAIWGEAQFAQTADATLWLASERGGVQTRDEAGHVLLSLRPGQGGLPTDLTIEQIRTAPDGGLWLAGSRGLLMWNAGRRQFERVPGTPDSHLYGFASAADGTLWLARFGALDRYRWDGGALRFQESVDIRHEFPAVAPSGLVTDTAGRVWVTSVRGLIRVNPSDRSVRVFGVHDGLPGQEFEDVPVLRPGDSRILAGVPEGLVLFDPAVVDSVTPAPRLIIESIAVRRGDDTVSLPVESSFTVGPDDRDVRIVARLLAFGDVRNHVYRFRLSGYDTGWVEVGASGERVFSQLESGSYRLEVQARAADNTWSKIQTVRFDVRPPWWQSWPALAGFFVVAALGVWWAASSYRTRLRRRHAWQLAQQRRELAEQASDAKSRFLATLGHEVRTPMTGVLGMSELLLGTPLNAQQRGYIGAIRGAGEHLLRLVNDALDLARIESGKLELADESFDLPGLVEELAALMGPLARQRGLGFALCVDEEVPRTLRGDAARVRQILLNLLGNAVKFTEHGRVSLAVSKLPDGICFEVGDTGPGLNAEQKSRLFRRFEQANGARTSSRYGGSGLGLAISQELAAAMGGAIEVDSAPGEGTRFHVRLPLPACPQAANHDERAADIPGLAPASLSLLLVEDDPTVADVLTGLLRLLGHHVVHVPHGLAALTAVITAPFDAALLDLDLPGMDGLALARQLRIQGFAAPLIAVTARADAAAEADAKAAGFDHFIRKPMTTKMLATLLQTISVRPVEAMAREAGSMEAMPMPDMAEDARLESGDRAARA